MTRCGYCRAPLSVEERLALGSGTVDDHLPCGKPAVAVYEGHEMRLEVAPPGSPIHHEGSVAAFVSFTAAERCAGMGV
ncbi:MAG: hypothetical protein ABW167_07695 [Baekduia sp.]